MFVRWKQIGAKKVLYAYVCSGQRVNGKVKSRTDAYLGSIPIDALERLSARQEFWYQVNTNLEKLDCDEEQKAKLRTAIAQKVAPE